MSEGRRGMAAIRRSLGVDDRHRSAVGALPALDAPHRHDVLARRASRSLIFVTLILAVHRRCSRCRPRRPTARRTPLADALFTAVSTICVTGLSTVDMAHALVAVRPGPHLHRRQHRRHGRADPRLDPRAW